MPTPIPIAAPLPEPEVLKKCDFLARAHVWPLKQVIDPRLWLTNFEPDELPFAYDLLDSFMYYADPLADELFRSAVQRLAQHVLDFNAPAYTVQTEWKSFVSSMIVCPVRGEEPNPTDSGYGYVRRFRDLFGLDEKQFMDEKEALALLYKERAARKTSRQVVFVDDFVGSGNQFNDTWHREVQVAPHVALSFARHAVVTGVRSFYCPLVCTALGAKTIAAGCSDVVLSPAHLIGEDYGAFHPESRVWAPERRAYAEDVLERIALRAGMPDTGVDSWRGFYNLGLGVAIRDSIPDACLGVFRWARNGWLPLFKKH